MHIELIRPPRLPKNATLGVIATSSEITRAGDARVERGYQRLRERGFEIVEAPNCRTVHGHAAGTVKERVDALHGFFADPEIDGIIAYWGGLNTHQLLEYLDWELIARNPKPLAGYDFPVMLDVDFGHSDPLITFPIGVRCRMDAGAGELELVEGWVG